MATKEPLRVRDSERFIKPKKAQKNNNHIKDLIV